MAGTTYDDKLEIVDYEIYKSLGKPLGMGEFGQSIIEGQSPEGNFDNRKYIEKMRTHYPAIAYWVTWHNWVWETGLPAWNSINANNYAKELLNDPDLITAETLNWLP